jgi:peptide/nickel transport system substrate-binding protein
MRGKGWKALGALAGALLLGAMPTAAQKRGGVLSVTHIDNPPSPSIHEEATASVVIPFMGLFNNLVLFDQHKPINTFDTIVPELATKWAWSEDRKSLTFTLREGVKWHDGKPFTAADVKCTWDMVSGLEPNKIRKSPRKLWWDNLEKITVAGPTEVTFHLKRPQPSFIALLATGWSPVYPCHVSSDAMRGRPIGTGPFKFVEFVRNESIRVARNENYWKPGLPYLDGIEFKIVPSRSTRVLAFTAGRFDMTYPTDISVPLMKDVRAGAPNAQCVMRPTAVSTNVIINREAPPFDNPDLRRAVALVLDRGAFIKILTEGAAKVGASMLPAPEGQWGMPKEMLETLPGYGPDIAANREQARALMRRHGYGPDNRLKMKVFTRDIPTFRDPALILSDQLREIFIDSELEVVDTTLYYNRVFRKEYTIGLNLTGNSVDDPDQNFYENYACGSLRNYPNYCNRELQAMFDQQSVEADIEKRKRLVWEIERRLIEDVARPIIMHNQGAVCWHPHVKNMSVMLNSIYNGWRWEDLWLDK